MRNISNYILAVFICFLGYSQENVPLEPELIFGEPEPQSFDVFAGNASESTKNRGIIGGGGYYYAVVTIAPRYEFQGDSTVTIFLGGERVSRKVIDRQNPGGLAVLTWSFDLMDMDHPARMVRKVTAYFNDDKTEVSEQQGAGVYIFNIPEGSSKLVSFDVNWAWGRNNTTLSFKGGAGPAGAGTSYKKWLWPIIVILLLLLLWRLRKLLMPIPVQDSGNTKKTKKKVKIKKPKGLSMKDQELFVTVEWRLKEILKKLKLNDFFKGKTINIKLIEDDKDGNTKVKVAGTTVIAEDNLNEATISISKNLAKVGIHNFSLLDVVISHELEHAKTDLPEDSEQRKMLKKLEEVKAKADALEKKKDKVSKEEINKIKEQYRRLDIERMEHQLKEEKRIRKISETIHQEKLKFEEKVMKKFKELNDQILKKMEEALNKAKTQFKSDFGKDY